MTFDLATSADPVPDPATFGAYEIQIDSPQAVGNTAETVTVSAKSGNTLTVSAMAFGHASGIYVHSNIVTATRGALGTAASHSIGAPAKFVATGMVGGIALVTSAENCNTGIVENIAGGDDVSYSVMWRGRQYISGPDGEDIGVTLGAADCELLLHRNLNRVRLNIGAGRTLSVRHNGSEKLGVTSNGRLRFAGLPTSATGLSNGELWNDAGTVRIV